MASTGGIDFPLMSGSTRMKNGVNNTAPSILEIQASSQKPMAMGNMYQNSNQYPNFRSPPFRGVRPGTPLGNWPDKRGSTSRRPAWGWGGRVAI